MARDERKTGSERERQIKREQRRAKESTKLENSRDEVINRCSVLLGSIQTMRKCHFLLEKDYYLPHLKHYIT